jgi:hypothetical protein
MHACIMMMMI